jgi:excisionase family DNA binding protein
MSTDGPDRTYHAEERDVLSYSEAALLLAVSERTLERWVRERRIPFVQLPRRGTWSGVRFVRSQLLKWLEQQTIRPIRSRRGKTVAVTFEED